MEGGDLNSFINRFKLLVRHAGYRPDELLVLQKFTNRLPFCYVFITGHQTYLFLLPYPPLSRSVPPYHTQITSDCPFLFSYPLSPLSLIVPYTI